MKKFLKFTTMMFMLIVCIVVWSCMRMLTGTGNSSNEELLKLQHKYDELLLQSESAQSEYNAEIKKLKNEQKDFQQKEKEVMELNNEIRNLKKKNDELNQKIEESAITNQITDDMPVVQAKYYGENFSLPVRKIDEKIFSSRNIYSGGKKRDIEFLIFFSEKIEKIVVQENEISETVSSELAFEKVGDHYELSYYLNGGGTYIFIINDEYVYAVTY